MAPSTVASEAMEAARLRVAVAEKSDAAASQSLKSAQDAVKLAEHMLASAESLWERAQSQKAGAETELGEAKKCLKSLEEKLEVVNVALLPMMINVDTSDGEAMPLEVVRGDTVRDVKAKLQRRKGILPEHQRLIYGGSELDDDRALLWCGVDVGATLLLVERRGEIPINVETKSGGNDGGGANAISNKENIDNDAEAGNKRKKRICKGGSFTQNVGRVMEQIEGWGRGGMATEKREKQAKAALKRQSANEHNGEQSPGEERNSERKSNWRDEGTIKKIELIPKGSFDNAIDVDDDDAIDQSNQSDGKRDAVKTGGNSKGDIASLALDSFSHGVRSVNVAMSSPSASDADDRRLLSSLESEDVEVILRVKHNDPECTRLGLPALWGLDGRGARRLGHLIGQSTYLKSIFLSNLRLNELTAEVQPGELAAEFCDGLRFNQSIETLSISYANLGGSRFSSLSSTLSSNPNLEDISLAGCNIDATALNLLSDALSERSKKTLKSLDLSLNRFGDVDLDKLVGALKGSKKLLFSLELASTGIGKRGCASLARLLCDRRSGLCFLDLADNSIDDTAVAILVESLAGNTELETLNLEGNSSITAIGLQKVLKLICDGSSIDACLESNHSLEDLGWGAKKLSRIMGSDSAKLLRASLKMNRNRSRFTARHKVMWSHARGDLNIGEDSSTRGDLNIGEDSSIDVRVLLRILGWISDGSSKSSAQIIRYHDPSFQKARIDAIRLDSFYRIVRARPVDLCSRATTQMSEKEKERREKIQKEGLEWRERRQAEYKAHTEAKNSPMSRISLLEQKRDGLSKQEEMLNKTLPARKKLLAALKKNAPASEQSKKLKEILNAQTKVMELKKEINWLVEEIEKLREEEEECPRSMCKKRKRLD